ncbi:MAG: GerMN domain-containing protein [Bacilli bacterium]|nr:GerMN domain-containing protein [Bacilli bacterium]
MLRKKALNRIYLTTLVLFIMLISFTFDYLSEEKNTKLQEIEYVANLNTTHIYLLNEDNYLVKVDILLNKKDVVETAREILNNLSVNNKKYNNLKGIIPSNTKINDIKYENNIITVDFSSDLLKVNSYLEEKVIESIVYSLLEIEGVRNVIIKINGENLETLEKSNKKLPILLNETFGINKTYDIKSLKDTKKVVLYYVFNNEDNDYFVPVTKYLNSKDDKVKIIIDSLQGNYFSNTNLSSYLNKKTNINFTLDEDILTFTFESLNEENLESVTYSLASSVFDSMDVTKVIFEVDNKIVDVRTKS